jgi:hypothetical protein
MTEKNNLDLKIIFLARDPRGIYSSRLKIYDRKKTGDKEITYFQKKMVTNVCQHTANFFEKRNSSSWLKKQSLIVKYEDLALDPEEKSKEIIKFSGFNQTDKIFKWIKDNTAARAANGGNSLFFELKIIFV